jgi:hypothetical protein
MAAFAAMPKRDGIEIDVEVELEAEPDADQWQQIRALLQTVGVDGRDLRATVSVPEDLDIRMWTAALAVVGRIESAVEPPVRIVGQARVRRSVPFKSKKKKKKQKG